jgi:hypothetical protein
MRRAAGATLDANGRAVDFDHSMQMDVRTLKYVARPCNASYVEGAERIRRLGETFSFGSTNASFPEVHGPN